jgi:hypothetical protein
MTVSHTFIGYGNHAYGSIAYGGGTALGSSGVQFDSGVGLQDPEGISFFATNLGSNCPNPGYGGVAYGEEGYGVLHCQMSGGVQFESIINSENPQGFQFLSDIEEVVNPNGIQFFATNLGFLCSSYGDVDYGSEAYGLAQCQASGGVQFDREGTIEPAQGFQFSSLILDYLDEQGVQFEVVIPDQEDPEGVQFEAIEADFPNPEGVQFLSQIVDYLNAQGIQFESLVNAEDPQGFQFDAISAKAEGLQFTVNLYNTNRLRVICEFPSRGASTTGGGNNAWGNPIGTGNNWVASSQAAGDFEAFRLNTDIVEEVWRSAGAVTGITIDCDTEVAQGVFLDTLAILNHNMTTSASITLIGSNSDTFAPIGVSTVLTSRDTNIYHIEEELPLTSYRYWRLSIDDNTNTEGYLEIGTIVFGAAIIFQGECITQRILKRTRHFADSVRTEGFTAVKNDRSIKDAVTLTFEKLDFSKGNFQSLSDIFKTARTSQKCLWIPTPSPTDASFTERFAVFAKMIEIPEQSHNVMGSEEGDYIDLTIDLDESE